MASDVSKRLISLDVFRGLAVAGMILVTDPGTYSTVYWPLLHAQWDGWTPTDIIFPSFLVAVGIAIPLSLDRQIEDSPNSYSHIVSILRRSTLLFLLGLFLNGFPDFHLHTLRIPGVLQRIALCYFIGASLYVGCRRIAGDKERWTRNVIGISVVILLAVYWAMLKLVPVPGIGAGRLDSYGNVGAYVDRSLFGIHHLWSYGVTPGMGVTFDPEGLLSTIPALCTLLMGVVAGSWIQGVASRSTKTAALAVGAICLVVSALALSPILVINKKIWTSTFSLLSGGIALLVFAFLYFALDEKRWRWLATPFLIFGKNAILAFVLSGVLTTALDRLKVRASDGIALSLHQWTYENVFASWLAPKPASLTYALLIVVVNLALLYPLYRKGLFVRL